MNRRAFAKLLPFLVLSGNAFSAKTEYAQVKPNRKFIFPRDHGAHPEFRTEWWYVTGWLDGPVGFQATFFRVRPEEESDNPSAFAPKQILFAHAAVSDPRRGRLLHDERAARAGLTLAHAETDRTGVWIDDWRLELNGDRYELHIGARDLRLELTLFARQLVLQGEGGFSRKGLRPGEASYYYSRPQLHAVGRVNGREVSGTAWLDHEWSSAYLAPEAAGWDWTGINLLDGGSMMAFQMRSRAGGLHYVQPGSRFKTLRTWRSPRTGAVYPVSMEVNGLRLEPLMDDQELDAGASAGAVYWEGAVSAFSNHSLVGRGYLELTGYAKPMKL